MSNSQPGEMIVSNQSDRLAVSHRVKHAFSLFNVGRATAIFTFLAMILFFSTRGGGILPNTAAYLATMLCVFFLPLIAVGIISGAKLGLFGAAEFFCGLAYLPMGTIGGAAYRERSYQMLALIYSGVGRFEEAIRCFKRHEYNFNIFDTNNGTAWNERRRLAEIYWRLGRRDEAFTTAEANIALSRHQLKDLQHRTMHEHLQCELISAGSIYGKSGRLEDAKALFQEAAILGDGQTDSMMAHLAASYARGLSAYFDKDFAAAATHFEHIAEIIQAARLNKAYMPNEGQIAYNQAHTNVKVTAKMHSELFAVSQVYLGRCYLQTTQLEKLPVVLAIIKSENSAEPEAAEDSVMAALLESDYWESQGQSDKSGAILQRLLTVLKRSDAKHDVLLALVTSRLSKSDESKNPELDSNEIASTDESVPRLAGPATRLRLPNIAASRHIANRAVLFFFVALAYTAYLAFQNDAPQLIALTGAFAAIAFLFAFNAVKKHVAMRKARHFTGLALQQQISPEEALIEIEYRPANFNSYGKCSIVEGPADCQSTQMQLALTDNTLYIINAMKAAGTETVKARLYRNQETGKILAVETLGRISTVIADRKSTRKKPGEIGGAPLILATVLTAASFLSPAQAIETSEDIDTNRPSFMLSPLVVPRGSLQLENGFLYQHFQHGVNYFELPETQVRLGLLKRAEFQVFVPQWVALNSNLNGASSIQGAGFKYQLPQLFKTVNASLVASVTVPTGRTEISGTGVQPFVQLPWTKQLTKNVAVGGMQSVGVVAAGRDVQWQNIWLVSRSFGPRTDVFAEYGGFYTQQAIWSNIAHFGVVRKINKNNQIDLQWGAGLNRVAPAAFVGVGYSVRFDKIPLLDKL